MHNRGSVSDEQTDARARELDGTELSLLLPAVLIVLALAIYPQYVVERVEPNAAASVAAVAKAGQVAERPEKKAAGQ
jgi:NADH:ubiquinone oxidoreductase subunit 4 (subunit M)